MIKKEQIVAGLAFGTLIGGLSGVLLAPQTGRKNREVLRDKMNRIKARVRRKHSVRDEELPEALASRDADYLH
jgi:gas vesicle protein